MRKTILAAGLAALVALTLAGCNKTQDQSVGANNAMANAPAEPTNTSAAPAEPTNTSAAPAEPTNTSAAPPGRGDPTRQ